jgi:hypothetical protein
MRLTPRWALTLVAALLVVGPAGYAATAAKHSRHRAFKIRGGLRQPLFPGASQPLELTLTNRAGVTLSITRLRVRVRIDAAHRAAGCSAKREFAIRQLPRSAFPIRLPGRRNRRTGRPLRITRTLTALRLRTRPWVGMRDLPFTNQGACKGARLRLRFRGRARKSRPLRRPAAAKVRTP